MKQNHFSATMRKFYLPLLVLPLIFIGAGCALLQPKSIPMKPVSLQYWRTEDEADSMTELIDAYRKIHPNVEVVYKKLPAADYEKLLLEALAEDRGPDMFSIPNVWLRGWTSKLAPMPKETTLPTVTVNEQKQIVTINKKTPCLTIREMLTSYVEIATKDAILNGPGFNPGDKPTDRIYGLPLSLDTLALFYNKDLLKNAQIQKPPETWRDLLDFAQIMTKLNDKGDILQSGAPLGTAANVRNFFDVVSALMMQNGAIMADDENDYPRFQEYPPGERTGGQYPPGAEALLYYDSFAIPGAPNYSWNDTLPDSLDAFVTGRTAFYFGYPADAIQIKTRAPKLDIGIAPLPQVDPGRVFNIARYPVEVVSQKSKNANEAWDFLQFISRSDKVSSFLFATKRPTALRSLIKEQMTNPDVGIFVTQILTARSWYKGVDYPEAVRIFAEMVDAKPTAEEPDPTPIVGRAAGSINGTMK
jgi:ABC-type glycerol-3-phosphate transport system substrate-binding protein